MDLILLPVLAIAATLFLLLLHVLINTLKTRVLFHKSKLPPGSLGWPLIGETPALLRSLKEAKPEEFTKERVDKYKSNVFKTSFLGESYIFFSGTAGRKFLFSNENNLVNVWWPKSIRKLFNCSLLNLVGEDAKRVRKLILTFIGPDTIKGSVEKMDFITRQHIQTYWEGKENVKVYPAVASYTFALACYLFGSIKEAESIKELGEQFEVLNHGLFSFSINIPGTGFYNSNKAANFVRKELKSIIRQRKDELEKKIISPSQDLVAHLLANPDSNGKFLSEMEIIDNFLLLLFAGYDTTKSAITLVIKYLAQMPHVYAKVLQENIEIAESKEAGELLKWEDVQRMRYSWSVVSEVMRISSSGFSVFRKAIVDFTYQGYTIPKGMKLSTSINAAHKDPDIFPDPENFDASRFEEKRSTPYSFIPFGGGPRMCLGNEFARFEILIFLHNIITKFKWDIVIPDEKFSYKPVLLPSQGFPVHLRPHKFQA